MQNIPKVSIIVPIHNAGVHLTQCLDTLINQTLKDIEIILVIDCPTDGSDKLAEQYASQDPRIKLIHNSQNLHVGLSRNEGLRIAQGEYIGFSDHDDYRELNMYEELYNKAKEGDTDIVCGFYEYKFPHKSTSAHFLPDQLSGAGLKEKIFSHLIGDIKNEKIWSPFTRNGSMWHAIYKKEVIDKYHITFLDNRKATFEDLFFLIQIFWFSNHVVYVPQTFYYHVCHTNNGFNQYTYNSTPRILEFLNRVDLFLSENQIREKYLPEYFSSVMYFIWSSIKNEAKHRSWFKACLQIPYIRKNKRIRNTLKEVPFSFYYIKRIKIKKTLLWILLRV